jgi:hypothetical protein
VGDDYSFLSRIGITPGEGVPVIEKHRLKILESLRAPGKGGSNFQQKLQMLTRALWDKNALASYDPEKVGKSLQSLVTILFFEERIPLVNYLKVADKALEGVGKKEKEHRKHRQKKEKKEKKKRADEKERKSSRERKSKRSRVDEEDDEEDAGQSDSGSGPTMAENDSDNEPPEKEAPSASAHVSDAGGAQASQPTADEEEARAAAEAFLGVNKFTTPPRMSSSAVMSPFIFVDSDSDASQPAVGGGGDGGDGGDVAGGVVDLDLESRFNAACRDLDDGLGKASADEDAGAAPRRFKRGHQLEAGEEDDDYVLLFGEEDDDDVLLGTPFPSIQLWKRGRIRC